MATEPPFRPGDVVRTKWYASEATLDRVVARCYPFNSTSGWNVLVEKPDACRCCNRGYRDVPALDANWFWLQRRNANGQ